MKSVLNIVFMIMTYSASASADCPTTTQILIEQAREALITRLQTVYNRVEVKAISQPKCDSDTRKEYQIRLNLNYPVAKRVCVWLINDEQRIAIWFAVKAYQNVLIVNQDMPLHSAITKRQVTLRERNIAGLSDIPELNPPAGNWLQASLWKNQILLKKHLVRQPQIVHGQSVRVTVIQKNIAITLPAQALSNGYQNQAIKLKNPANKKIFSAIVTGPQQAEVR